MQEPRMDLLALQALLLNQLFEEAERKWNMENEAKNNRAQHCAECESRRAPPESERESAANAPARHWPPHRRFWHRSPREWREARGPQQASGNSEAGAADTHVAQR